VLRDVIGLDRHKIRLRYRAVRRLHSAYRRHPHASCSVPIGALDGAKVITIEGLSSDNNHPVQRAWIKKAFRNGGYCVWADHGRGAF